MGCGASNKQLGQVSEPQHILNKPQAEPIPNGQQQSRKNKISEDIIIQDLDGENDVRTELKISPDKGNYQKNNKEDQNINTIGVEQSSQILELKRYKKGQLIDKGAYGKVYKGIDTLTNQVVAIKYIEISGTFQEAKKEILSLKKEITLLKKLNHPNIVQYYDFDVSDDKTGVDIILEYAPNGSLRMALNKQKFFDETKTALYTRQVLEGLEYLHKNNIIHRDLKGANLLLDAEGRAKLTDFGTAKQLVTDLRKSQIGGEEDIANMNKSLKGTPNWMAPEVIERVGHSSSADIWSIGCIVIEMLTGKPPYPNMSAKEVFTKIVQGVLPDYPKGISYECQEFLDGCLQIDPKKRLTVSQLLRTPFILRKKIRRLQSQNSLASQEELLEQINSIQQGQNIQQEYQYQKKGSMASVKGQSSTHIKAPLIVQNQKDAQSQPILLNKHHYNPDYTQANQLKYQEYQNTQLEQLKDRTKSLNNFANNNEKNAIVNKNIPQILNQNIQYDSKSNKNIEDDILQLAKSVKRQQDFVQVNVNPGYQQYEFKPKTETGTKFSAKEIESNQQEQFYSASRNQSRQNTFSQQKIPPQNFKSSLVNIQDEDLDTSEIVRRSQKSLTLLKQKYQNLNGLPQQHGSQPIIDQNHNQHRERFISNGQYQKKKNGETSFEDVDLELPQMSRDIPFSRGRQGNGSQTKMKQDINQSEEEEYDTEQVSNSRQEYKENEYLKHENKIISTKSANMQRMKLDKQQARNQEKRQPSLSQNKFLEHQNQVINTDIAQRERHVILQEKQEFVQDKIKRQQAWEDELQRELEYQRSNPPAYLKY